MNEHMEKFSLYIGQVIRKLRKKEGLSLTQAGERVDLSKSYYSRIELGEYPTLSIRRYLQIAESYNITLTELVAEAEKIYYQKLNEQNEKLNRINTILINHSSYHLLNLNDDAYRFVYIFIKRIL
ncbi:helix-turn-helix transcriptional regulator [Staphylococcus hominis]|uniref:helix-turn-helix domain-containing protein n=1 Tax=Staphylococcus hominis TaxID=1290 RepID=UPI0016432433|nr:helix-turn-helix transcriptional regulator [Staphylococcus hominis]MEC5376820.1 helix-turn-helix transcriptional regulator [Staphylococcus hominis]MEC5415671.1 helix-turn-helix transcriptional regulator [Staphylococcus hominis]